MSRTQGKLFVSCDDAADLDRKLREFGVRQSEFQKQKKRPEVLGGIAALAMDVEGLSATDYLKRVAKLPVGSRPVWRTITTGDKSKEELRDAVCGVSNIYPNAEDVFSRITVASRVYRVELVVATVTELGYPDGARTDQILEAGQKFGWTFCLSEDALRLRLGYVDQPDDECVWDECVWSAASDVPPDSCGRLHVFGVGRDEGGLVLYAYCGVPGDFWAGENRCVFRRQVYLIS